MVMKMNEPTLTTVLDEIPQAATTVTITFHPQPKEPSKEIACDNHSAITTTTGETSLSNMSPSSDDSDSLQNSQMMVKKSLKLDLTHNNNEIRSIDTGSPGNDDDLSCKSPTSPRTCKKKILICQQNIFNFSHKIPARNRSVPHQTSVTSQVEVVDDRKALRDALYQGIFHRHRRTIFAVGSFLRMLKSRNSQYNTIRSTSEGEEEPR
jgi:hypothetical protein